MGAVGPLTNVMRIHVYLVSFWSIINQIKEGEFDLSDGKEPLSSFKSILSPPKPLQVTVATRFIEKVLLQNYTTVTVWYKNRQ